MELFEFTKTIFENPQQWEEVSNGDKKKHFFITNRMFSIGHPLQAHLLQHIKANPVNIMDIWQVFMKKKYQKTPGWMFTKGVAKNKLEKEKKTSLSEELIKEYCRVFRLDYKSVKDSLMFFHEKTVSEIKEFEKIMKQK